MNLPAATLSLLYLAYPLLPVNEESGGGAEQVLFTLESQMARRGHATVVAGCEGSQVSGELLATCGPPAADDDVELRARQQSTLIAGLLAPSEHPFDLVHDQSGLPWHWARQVDAPVLITLHLPRYYYPEECFKDLGRNLFFNCVSEAQAAWFTGEPRVMGVVQNGIHVEPYPFTPAKQDYVLWLGRICPEKGPQLALEVAERAGLPIVLAGQVYPFSYHRWFFQEEIQPRLERLSPRARLVMQPGVSAKMDLLRHARALLVPSLVDETSSLVSMEAMACGTPVIAFRRGALPEVLEHGVTGLIVESDVEEMAAAVAQAGQFNPYACRRRVEEHFTAARMAGDYERLYKRVLAACAEDEEPLLAA